ncbi:uncharacterized protein LOC119281619 [Triticum dicoccoides]|uniref:Uncharacterized protein n=1 Tax=Triticum turgidum subsp. durum TaxID=4567 RepID=A0A9R1QQF9_TRITD|nr:uncharacterized protein LOC119281619 [Triticum dicoccoides]VAH80743.1 unnamed protein product [Triticum turgidum subsp. durum]
MSQAPNAEPDERDGFTCGTLFTCLCLPGLSKKKPEETGNSGKSQQPAAPEQDQRTEQEPPQVLLTRAASLEKLECSSLYSGSNIVFDFLVEPGGRDDRGAVHGYCPSPCFDLPVELIRAGERCGAVASDAPVTSAFVFDGHRDGAALKRMASCLASSVPTGGEARPTHLVRFLSASGCAVPVRSPVTSFGGPANGGGG